MRTKKEINVQIGEQIKLARESAKLTQEQFAEQIDVSPQYVSDVERGVVGVSISTLKRICLTLCISSDQLLFGKKSDNRTAILAEKCHRLSDKQFCILSEIADKFIEALESASSSPK